MVCAKVKLEENTELVICQVYRSPNTDKNIFNLELEQCLIWLNKLNKISLISGDFNFDLFSMESNTSTHTFFTTLLSHGFFPTISRTTRSSHHSCSLIDNIFCNDLSKVMHSGIILSDLSDHFPIFSSLNCNTSTHEPKVHHATTLKVFNYNKIDEFNSFLIDKLENVETETFPDIIANTIVNALNEGISKYSYSKRVSRKNTHRRPWMTSALLLSIEHKSSLFTEKLKHPTPGNILTRAPLGGGQILPPPLSNIRDNLRTT